MQKRLAYGLRGAMNAHNDYGGHNYPHVENLMLESWKVYHIPQCKPNSDESKTDINMFQIELQI